MAGFLFSETIFGPVRSRRLGNSLGINLLPNTHKICTFDCIYCECGWSPDESDYFGKLPTRNEVAEQLEVKLLNLKANKNFPDSITFAGNGEPTIHPEFSGIIHDTIKLRDKFFPEADVTVLSNSSMIHKPEIFNALNQVDNNILKLDAGFDSTFRLINRPRSKELNLNVIVSNLRKFGKKAIIQTLFVQGEFKGCAVDNTTDAEVAEWINHIKLIKPRYVMLYPIDRQTPTLGLKVVGKDKLLAIAEKLKEIGVEYKVY